MTTSETYLNLLDADTPIYRIERLSHLLDALQTRRVYLASPGVWADPTEEQVRLVQVVNTASDPFDMTVLDGRIRAAFAQCWSLCSESDPLWRAYSSVRPDTAGVNSDVGHEGLQVRSAPRKLLETLRDARPDLAWMVGRVTYVRREALQQWIADEIGRRRLDAFSTAVERARSLLIKRLEFAAEEEVRLIAVSDGDVASEAICIAVDPNALYDQVVLDPRIGWHDRQARERELRAIGFEGAVIASDLYERRMLEVTVSWPT